MIEVEAKIQVPDPKPFRQKAAQLGKFKAKEKKIDDYYTLEPLSPKHYPQKSLRIRKIGRVHQINFKQKISHTDHVDAKNEHEFTVESIKDFLVLIREFGFKHWLRKEKISEVYEIDKHFHIEINHLKNLGWFLEVEILTDEKHITQARERILDIIEKLGADKNKIIEKGYTKLLWERKISGLSSNS